MNCSSDKCSCGTRDNYCFCSINAKPPLPETKYCLCEITPRVPPRGAGRQPHMRTG